MTTMASVCEILTDQLSVLAKMNARQLKRTASFVEVITKFTWTNAHSGNMSA